MVIISRNPGKISPKYSWLSHKAKFRIFKSKVDAFIVIRRIIFKFKTRVKRLSVDENKVLLAIKQCINNII